MLRSSTRDVKLYCTASRDTRKTSQLQSNFSLAAIQSTAHTKTHPIPRMLSVQMGQASDTCSIKGIRGDLTTLLSASWPHIDQPVWDHSQPV